MTQQRPRSRFLTCLLLFILLVCLVFISIIVLPQVITSQAEKLFGPPTPQLSTFQQLYLSISLIAQSKDLTQSIDSVGSEIRVTIDQGESIASIINQLFVSGLITNPGVFLNYLQYTGLDTQIKAGEYLLTPSMSAVEIAQAMQISMSPNVTLTILPGWRVEEIANSLPSTGLEISPTDFLQAVEQPPQGYSFSTCLGEQNLEGFFYPSAYSVPRKTTMDELLAVILTSFEANLTEEMQAGFTSQGLDLCQAVVLASIVEREAMLDDEMPLIASVFYNRLNTGSVLASDPTVQYALGFNSEQGTWWTNPLTLQGLKVDSPYNTYIFNGLPPGPIANPGQAALEAVAFPAETPYFYFRSACDNSGRHLFAETYEEHVSNACP